MVLQGTQAGQYTVDVILQQGFIITVPVVMPAGKPELQSCLVLFEDANGTLLDGNTAVTAGPHVSIRLTASDAFGNEMSLQGVLQVW